MWAVLRKEKNGGKGMAAQEKNSAASAVGSFGKAIGSFFRDFGTAVVKGDAFVKLSLLWMDACVGIFCNLHHIHWRYLTFPVTE